MKSLWATIVVTCMLTWPSTGQQFTVIVYGATSGGVIAAVSAKRQGAGSVALLVTAPHGRIGGMSSGGLMHTDVGNAAVGALGCHTATDIVCQVIGGMAHEFYSRNARMYNKTGVEYNLEPHVAQALFHTMLQEAGVAIFNTTRVETVTKNAAGSITHLTTVGGKVYSGSVFIDASYEGDLLARAGANGPPA